MRLNPRHSGERLSRSALNQELRAQLAELRALLLYFGSAEIVVLHYYDFVRYA